MKFLMGLNESFAQVKAQILLMDPLPFINKVYSLLIQEQMQRVLVMDLVLGLNQLLWLQKVSLDS